VVFFCSEFQPDVANMGGSAGLGMDVALFDDKGDLQPKGPGNMLRPEAAESLFYMWRVTGEPKYREWGWRMFQAFLKHSRTMEGAFAAVKVPPPLP
jgi:rhamnogalacturonyl hydrolase YesR